MTKKESIFVFPQFLRERSLKKKVEKSYMQNVLELIMSRIQGYVPSEQNFPFRKKGDIGISVYYYVCLYVSDS